MGRLSRRQNGITSVLTGKGRNRRDRKWAVKEPEIIERQVWRFYTAGLEDGGRGHQQADPRGGEGTKAFLEPPAGTHTCQHFDFSSDLQNWEVINLCYLKPLSLWQFLILAIGNKYKPPYKSYIVCIYHMYGLREKEDKYWECHSYKIEHWRKNSF